MKKFFRVWMPAAAFLFLTAGFILFSTTFARPVSLQFNPQALELMEEVNALRAAKNLPPYQVNEILMRVAQAHAEHIAQTGYLSRYARGLSPHQRAIEAGYPVAGNVSQGGLYAENLFAGLKASPADAVKKWSEDSQNFRALYGEDLEDAGAGVAYAGDVAYYVLDAGSALDDPAYWRTATPTSDGIIITSTPLEDGAVYHVVQAKEYLWNIALAYNTSVEELIRLNRLSRDEIFEGQKLLVYMPKPQDVKTPTPGVTFTATFCIPTSTATQPVTPTSTFTPTPQPVAPASLRSGQIAVSVIVALAFIGAAIGALLSKGNKKQEDAASLTD